MKNKLIKNIFLIVLMLIVFIPNNVLAAKISNVRIGSIENVKKGKSVTVPFYINLSGVSNTDINSFGILSVGFELIYDEDLFSITNIASNGFTSTVYQENGEYLIFSALNVGDSFDKKCVDNILFCGEYEIDITFFATDTTETISTIGIGEVAVAGLQLSNGTHPTYSEDDIIVVEEVANKTKTINIIDNDGEIITTPKSIVKSSKPIVDDTSIINNIVENKENTKSNENNSDKSSNNYLSKLDITGYLIDFYKRTNEYTLEVEEGINKLDVIAELEDKKATLEIVGANDLKGNDNKVEIIVTAENGTKNIYTINVINEKEITPKSLSDVNTIKKIKDFFIEYKLYFIIGGSILLFIIILSIIINSISNKKLGDKFDSF